MYAVDILRLKMLANLPVVSLQAGS
jgi:hypothetical protein